MANGYEGSCHCGALRFIYTTALEPSRWPIRSCQCSFCMRHGARCTSDPAGTLRLEHRKPDRLFRYRFGLNTADFLICQGCGVYLAAVISTREGGFGLVNINTLEDEPPALPQPTPTVYDSESEAERIGRRQQKWTPVQSRRPR